MQTIESDLINMGFQMIAVSTDRPGLLKENAGKSGVKYMLMSDSEMTGAKSLGIAFKMDDDTVIKYKTSYGIDIEADSGQKHHLLPVPAVFVLDTKGIIQFSYVNPNFSIRLDPGILLEAAKVVKKQSEKGKK